MGRLRVVDSMKDKKIIAISNGNVVTVKTSVAEKMKHWEKLKSPSAKDRKAGKRGDNHLR